MVAVWVRCEALIALIHDNSYSFFVSRKSYFDPLRDEWVVAARGFADRGYEGTRQTRRSPTHSHHKMTSNAKGAHCHFYDAWLLPYLSGCETQPLTKASHEPNYRSRSRYPQPACRTPPPPVARELAPARWRSRRKTGAGGLSGETRRPVWGRFAAQREQAPSPQGVNSYEIFGSLLATLQNAPITRFPADSSLLWERACSRSGISACKDIDCAAAIASKLAPTLAQRHIMLDTSCT
ncbi:hypothetical protein SAMN03159443_04642 [Pseudomonas sp. NFACC15-1]|nr:hypothetical protein SAMN03159443_04642 [Pseudomonas sp. NFACC15-1]SDZ02628.1 hypothetical protein SAMN03159380_05218 [Pseudomonas sp. NFACC14]